MGHAVPAHLLATPIEVTSRCPRTGQPVTLTVTPTGITRRRPPGIGMSFLEPDAVDLSDLQSSFCGEVHFLADAAAATRGRPQPRQDSCLIPTTRSNSAAG